MAWSAVSSAALKVGELLTQEATSLWGVEEQVNRLQTELRWMQSFLVDAEARQGEGSGRVRLWVAEIRDLAYDAEDVVETFSMMIGLRRRPGFSNVLKRSACILNEAWLLHKVRSEIEEITTKISNLTQRLQTYGIKELREGEGPSSSTTRKQELRRSYPHVVEDNIVGFNDEIKELVSVLVDEAGRSNYRVVSICGMGGLGKTTLAKMVYHHSRVRSHFNHLAWVYVSQQCQSGKVWTDILASLKIMDKEEARKMREEDLAEILFNFLKDKRCLVILDDVWSTEDWDSIKVAFPMRETVSSKILLTSRNIEVAVHADRRGYVHELKCLKEEESWVLFQKFVFPETDSPENRVDEKIVKLGKEMVRHCAGLPLAIVVLGGTLATKNPSVSEWQMVSANVKSYLKKCKGQVIEDVLELSYDNLPPYLKPCFLYLSLFPEDYEIPVERLVQLWVAEGIVSSKHDGRDAVIEDVAESYLIELVERCMIQVGERDALLKIRTCRMHDLMRDLCLSKAKQESYVYIIDHSSENQRIESSSALAIRGVRRVAAHVYPQIQCIKSPHLRSLLFFFEFYINVNKVFMAFADPEMVKMLNYIYEQYDRKPPTLLFIIFVLRLQYRVWRSWRYMLKNFKLLRVLCFEWEFRDAGFKLSSSIGDLVHLRFLSLNRLTFVIPKLPSSLGKLRCLQTLDLRVDRMHFTNGYDGRRIHVPDVIWRMKQLRHLYLPEQCNSKTKLKLGTLRNLLTLVNFNTRNCFVGDLVNLKSLRVLQIFGPFRIGDHFLDLCDNPCILKVNNMLRSLSIGSDDETIEADPRHVTRLLSDCANILELSLVVKMRKLPEHNHFSSNVAYIYLSRCNLDEDPMPTLEKLPNLRVLKVDKHAFNGAEMACSAQGFPKLDSLTVRWLDNLKEWKVDEGAMPALRHLQIYYCLNLNMLPKELRFITALKELKIEYMPKAFKDKLVEGGEDFFKVQHIPSIIFQNSY